MRVLAINDISCIGKCSLTVSLPILSACGVTCDVLPTALLSTHTGGFEGYAFKSLTDDIPAILRHWKKLGIKFDVIYSGYLGSEEQIRMVLDIKRDFLKTDGKFIVDPVMGDSGKLYAGFSPSFVAQMRLLCKEAEYILPNATEACYLANVSYPPKNIPSLLSILSQICPKPIVTGIVENNTNSIYYIDERGEQKHYSTQNVDGFFCGAGDVFASAFVGALARGKSEERAIALSAEFVSSAIRRSAKEVEDKRFGLNFEKEIFPFLKSLNE